MVIPAKGDEAAVAEALRLAKERGWIATVAKGGRPRLMSDPEFRRRWFELRPEIEAGRLSKREAARLLGVDPASVGRFLRRKEGDE